MFAGTRQPLAHMDGQVTSLASLQRACVHYAIPSLPGRGPARSAVRSVRLIISCGTPGIRSSVAWNSQRPATGVRAGKRIAPVRGRRRVPRCPRDGHSLEPGVQVGRRAARSRHHVAAEEPESLGGETSRRHEGHPTRSAGLNRAGGVGLDERGVGLGVGLDATRGVHEERHVASVARLPPANPAGREQAGRRGR
jgi:hypothetical protein